MRPLGCTETSVSSYRKYAALRQQKSENLRRNQIVGERILLKWTLKENNNVAWTG